MFVSNNSRFSRQVTMMIIVQTQGGHIEEAQTYETFFSLFEL